MKRGNLILATLMVLMAVDAFCQAPRQIPRPPDLEVGPLVRPHSFNEDIDEAAKDNVRLLSALKESKLDCCGKDEAQCGKLVEKYHLSIYLITFADGRSQYISPFATSPTKIDTVEGRKITYFSSDKAENIQPFQSILQIRPSGVALQYIDYNDENNIKSFRYIQKLNNPDRAFDSKIGHAACALKKQRFTDVAPKIKAESHRANIESAIP